MSGVFAPEASEPLAASARGGLFGGCDWVSQAARDSDAEIERVIERLKLWLAGAGPADDEISADRRRQLEAYEAEAGRRMRARRRRAARVAAAGPGGLRPVSFSARRHRP